MSNLRFFFYKKSLSFLLLTVVLLCMLHDMPSFAQTSSNPFELQGQKPTTAQTPPPADSAQTTTAGNPFEIEAPNVQETIRATTTTPGSESSSGNPFELQAPASTPASYPVKAAPQKATQKPPMQQGSSLENDLSSSGFLFILILSMTLLFAVLLTFFRPFFVRVYRSFINDSQLRNAYREMGSRLSPPYLLLYAMFIINAGILAYIILRHFDVQIGYGRLSVLFLIFGLSAIFLGKHLLLRIVGSVFAISKEMDLYNFTIVIFNCMLGIFFVPINLLLAYAPDQLLWWVIYGTFVLIGLIYAYRSLRGLLIGSKYLSFHKFHFFMYLCTIEIVPLALVTKFILNQFS